MSDNRRKEILKKIKDSFPSPITASSLAEIFGVSRQIIVGDIAILRAAGEEIVSTPRGYKHGEEAIKRYPYEGIIACRHFNDRLQDELYTVVDFGGVVINTSVEHPVYGQLSGILDIKSRYEADLFVNSVNEHESLPLSSMTDGVHIHRIGTADKESFELIKKSLLNQGILLPESP